MFDEAINMDIGAIEAHIEAAMGPQDAASNDAQNVQRAYLFAYRSAEIGIEPIVILTSQPVVPARMRRIW